MPRVRKQNAPLRRSPARFVVGVSALWLLAGCAETAAPIPTDIYDPLLHVDAETTELPPWQYGDSTADTGDAAVECPQAASKTDGTCCPTGLYWDGTAGQCLPAGPSGCFTTGAEDPVACVPRWCFSYVDDSGKACTPGPETCRAVTAVCPENAAQLNVGCPAGQAPEPNCVPAGTVTLPIGTGAPIPWHEGDALPAVAPLTLLTGPPALPPPVTTPQWCNDGAGAVIDATGNPALCVTATCTLGQRPNPAQPAQCQDIAGPAWTCPPGFVVDGTSCAPDPADCTDPWGGVTPGPKVVFVSASAAAGGTGSQGAPFTSLTDAVNALPAGGTIAIGAGVYAENLSLLQPISLRGSCAKDVLLQGAAGSPTVLIAEQTGSQVSNLTVSGGRYGIRVEGAVAATIDHVYVHSAAQGGIYALDGANATVKSVFVHTTAAGDNKAAGHGIAVEGSTLTATHVRLSGNREYGLYGSDATLNIKGLAVDGTLAQLSDNAHGYGIYAVGTGTFSGSDVRVTANRGFGMRLEGPLGASGSNWWIDGTLASGDQTAGIGLAAFAASVKVTDLRVTNSHQHGIWVVDAASVSGHNVLVSGTVPQASDSTGGQGVVVEGDGSSAQFSGLYVHSSYTQGISAAGAGAVLGLDFALINATQPQSSDKSAGGGVAIVDGAKLALPASGVVTIADSFGNGLLVSNASWQGGTIHVQDTQVALATGQDGEGAVIASGAQVTDATLRVINSRETGISIVSSGTVVKNTVLEADLTTPSQTSGGGILIADGAKVQGRVTALGNRDYGLTVDGKGTQLTASASSTGDPGAVIGFTQMNADGTGGYGIQVTGGAALKLTGARVQNSVGHGIFVYGSGSSINASQVEISATALGTSPAWGRGISISSGASATFSGLHIAGSQDVGLFVADTTTTAAIDDFTVEGGTRGAAIQNRAVVTGHRWRLQNHSEIALIAVDGGTRVTAYDLAIHSVGYGVEIANLATARLSRVAVVGAQGVGLIVDGSDASGAASSLDVFDSRVSAVTANAIGLGHGFVAQAGGILHIAGAQAHDWAGIGIVGSSGTLNAGGVALHTAPGSGIRALDSDVKLSGIRTQDVTGAAWSQSGGAAVASECAFLNTTPDGVGNSNGLELTSGCTATLARMLVSGMQSAGIVLVNASVTGDRVRASGNSEGLSREASPTDVWVRSLFFANSAGDIVDPGDVPPSGVPSDVTVLDGSDSP